MITKYGKMKMHKKHEEFHPVTETDVLVMFK